MQFDKGMIRRVDNLGRIVIPKEIRESLKIQTGSVLEFALGDDNTMHIKKYHKINEIYDFTKSCCNICKDLQDCIVLITDDERVIYEQNNVFKNKLNLNTKIFKTLKNGHNIKQQNIDNNFDGVELKNCKYSMFPIYAYGDIYGSVIFIYLKQNVDYDVIAEMFATFLSRYLEL